MPEIEIELSALEEIEPHRVEGVLQAFQVEDKVYTVVLRIHSVLLIEDYPEVGDFTGLSLKQLEQMLLDHAQKILAQIKK